MPYTTFISNLENASQLVDIAKGITEPKSIQLLYRSTVVLSVAHWQNFNETLILEYAKMIKQRANSSGNLPHVVKREIGKWVMQKQGIESHPEKTAKLIWEYAEGVWKQHYEEFAHERIDALNTPNSKNLVELYKSILGIEDISADWSKMITAYKPAEVLDDILNTRHKIAHGSFSNTLTEGNIKYGIAVLKEIATITNSVAKNETDKLLENCGSHYTLDTFDLVGLIKWLAEQPEPRTFKVPDLSSINRIWFANHNKLSYDAWGLLEGPTDHRMPTSKFYDFVAGKIAIPFEIVSFGGVDSIAKPGTPMVFYKDL